MALIKFAIALLLGALPASAQITTKGNLPVRGNTVLSQQRGIVCGPPNYLCSTTSTAIVPLPNPLPPTGPVGRGNVFTDNLSGAQILRLTDANSSADFYANCPDTKIIPGVNWHANFSGNDSERTISADSTKVAVGRAAGGQYDILVIDPVALKQYGCMYAVPSKNISFDQTNPNILWDLELGTKNCSGFCFMKYDFTGCTVGSCSPTITKIYDFKAGCLAGVNAVKWQSGMSMDSTSTILGFGISDTGGQETGVLGIAYKIGSGCRVVNFGAVADGGFQPQTVGWADWGSARGPLTFANASNPNESFTDHETFGFNNSRLEISGTGCTPYPPNAVACTHDTPFVWDVGTNTIYAAYVSGHFAMSQNLMANGNFGGGQMATVDSRNLVGNPPPQTKLIASQNLAGFAAPNVHMDQHSSWNNALTSDTAPVFVNWDTVGIVPPLMGTPQYPFAGPYNSEVDLYPASNPGSPNALIHRMFHTYSSTCYNSGCPVNDPDFQVVYTDGSVAMRGDIYVFTSDMVLTLGTDNNGNPRGDVFVARLP